MQFLSISSVKASFVLKAMSKHSLITHTKKALMYFHWLHPDMQSDFVKLWIVILTHLAIICKIKKH